MQDLTISLEQALALRERGALLIDARSPAEFAAGTIPGAVNIPLFDDDERARVGTIYKQDGKSAARLLGVDLTAPKLPELARRVRMELENRRSPGIVFCWRGGMRSRAMTTLLALAGLPVRQMEGGHKAFRSLVREFLERGEWGRLVVLRGLTGVGKTRLLQRLETEGYPVLDLEGLANHRGSAFGGLGLGQQPSQKNFEARLWDVLRNIPPGAFVLAEGESRHIGRLILPLKVYESLQRETSLWINASMDYRVRVIRDSYPTLTADREILARTIEGLKERLGKAGIDELLVLLRAERWDELIRELMVRYYDPLYRHSKPEGRKDIDIEPEEEGIERLKKAIQEILNGKPEVAG